MLARYTLSLLAVLAVAPTAPAADQTAAARDGSAAWVVVRATAAPAVIESVDQAATAKDARQGVRLTVRNASTGTLENVTVFGRIFTFAGGRKGGFVVSRGVLVAPDEKTQLDLAPRPELVQAGDTVVLTIGQARYRDASHAWQWTLRDQEELRMVPAASAELEGVITLANSAAPEPDLDMCEWCAGRAGICGYKPASNGNCSRPGCLKSLSCKVEEGCTIECTGANDCC